MKFAVVALVLATIGLAPPLHAQQSPAPGTAPDETAQQATPPEPTSKVTVVDAAGKPVRRATLYIIDPKGTMRKKVYSGVDGTAELPLPEKTSQAVIAVSSDEAFTIVDAKKIRAAGEAPFTLAIPASSASIEVHATLESGAPATGVSFAIKYGGIPLPPELLTRLEHAQGHPFTTNTGGVASLAGLPQGTYQLAPTGQSATGEPLQLLGKSSIEATGSDDLAVIDVVLR